MALVGWENPGGAARREYEDAGTITAERGGRLHNFSKDNRFKYAAITTQFFASALAIDDRAELVGAAKSPWTYVRATSELPFARGTKTRRPETIAAAGLNQPPAYVRRVARRSSRGADHRRRSAAHAHHA